MLTLLLAVSVMMAEVAEQSLPSSPQVMPLLSALDRALYDWRFQKHPVRRISQQPIVIIDIDEASLREEGRWPWSRTRIAMLLRRLKEEGVSVIGLDMVFSEPETNPVRVIANEAGDWPPSLRQRLLAQMTRFDADRQLQAALGDESVLGFFLHDEPAHLGELPFPFQEVPAERARSLSAVIEFHGYTSNLSALTQAAAGAGFLTVIPDRDGVIRRAPMILRYGQGLFPSLSLAMAQRILKAPDIHLHTVTSAGKELVTGISVGDRFLRTDAGGFANVPYIGGARSYPYVSASDVLRHRVTKGRLQGAIVLLGTSALGLYDMRTTPLQSTYPGVEVHANLLDAILSSPDQNNQFIYRPDWEIGLTLVLLLVLGISLSSGLPRLSPLWMVAVVVAALLGCIAFNVWLWDLKLDIPLGPWLLVVVLVGLFNILLGFFKASRQRREIQSIFGQYVPSAHVAQILERPGAAALEGDSREMTVLFADIRGFTTLSESLDVVRLKLLLNRYLTPVTRIIFDHEGTIDKYVGDMVMAFWNAPLPDENHADHAVATALAINQKMDELRREFRASGLPEIHVGIGINTGIMNVGDMGSEYRRAYTALGDAVNLGSRLEGLTKYYGVRILVGQATQQAAPGYLYRPVDRLIVKGKHVSVDVYEPLMPINAASAALREQVRRHQAALEAYFAQQWDVARQGFVALAAESPEVPLYPIFLARIDKLQSEGCPPGWAGTYLHEIK